MKRLINKILLFSLVLTAVLAINSCEELLNNVDKPVILEGYVTNQSNQPLPNSVVKVYVGDKILTKSTTDENGYYKTKAFIPNTPNLMISVAHDGYKSINSPYSTLKKEIKDGKLNFILQQQEDCCNIINVKVKDANGNILKGVEVKLGSKEREPQYKYTNELGTVTFENICNGPYWLRIAHREFKVVEKDFFIDSCQTLNFEIVLNEFVNEHCGKVFFQLKDKNTEQFINEATISTYVQDAKIKKYTNKYGIAVFDNLPFGVYIFNITRPGYEPITDTVTVSNCDTVRVYNQLKSYTDDTCCNNRLKITIKKEGTDIPVKGATIKIYSKDKLLKEKVTGEDGKVVFEELCSGNYGVLVSYPQNKPFDFGVSFGCGENKEFTKYISFSNDTCCNSQVKIKVRNQEGQNVQNATVRLWSKDKIIAQTLTNEEGWAVFDSVCVGNYAISIITDRYKGLEFAFEIGCNVTKTFEKTLVKKELCDNSKLQIKVFEDDTDIPISYAKIKIYSLGKVVYEGTANANGELLIKNLIAPANYKVFVSKDGYKPEDPMVEMKDCKLYNLVVELDKE